jgi:hypothetical protein
VVARYGPGSEPEPTISSVNTCAPIAQKAFAIEESIVMSRAAISPPTRERRPMGMLVAVQIAVGGVPWSTRTVATPMSAQSFCALHVNVGASPGLTKPLPPTTSDALGAMPPARGAVQSAHSEWRSHWSRTFVVTSAQARTVIAAGAAGTAGGVRVGMRVAKTPPAMIGGVFMGKVASVPPPTGALGSSTVTHVSDCGASAQPSFAISTSATRILL